MGGGGRMERDRREVEEVIGGSYIDWKGGRLGMGAKKSIGTGPL